MKLRSFFLTLAAGAITLLLIFVGSIYWILAQSPLSLKEGGVITEPSAAIYVPRQAPLMVSILANPDRIFALGKLAAPLAQRRRVEIELNQLKKSLLANTNLDYQKDIQPWLGDEITLAVTSLDFDRDPENGIQPGYLLAVNSKDPELAREFLQISFSQQALAATSDLVFEQYKGVNLIYKRPLEKTKTAIASAVVGDMVLFANHPKVLKEAVNNVQASELNLKNSPAYQDALQTIVEPRIGLAYLNLPLVSAWITNQYAPQSLEVKQTMTVALSLKPEGLNAQTALIGVTGEENQAPILSSPVKALEYLPPESILSAAGVDLNQFWQQISTGLETDSPLQQLLTIALSRLESPLGISLPEDVFSWVQGEYGLSLVSFPGKKELDWVFAAEKTDDAQADEKIEYLDKLAKDQGLSVGTIPISDTKITAWTQLISAKTQDNKAKKPTSVRLDAEVKGVHTTLGNYEIFASSLAALDQVFSDQQDSLLTSQKFTEAIAPLPTENNGYFYIDWSRGEPILQQQFPLIQVMELAGKPLFNHLRSLSITSLGSQNNVRRATVFLRLTAN